MSDRIVVVLGVFFTINPSSTVFLPIKLVDRRRATVAYIAFHTHTTTWKYRFKERTRREKYLYFDTSKDKHQSSSCLLHEFLLNRRTESHSHELEDAKRQTRDQCYDQNTPDEVPRSNELRIKLRPEQDQRQQVTAKTQCLRHEHQRMPRVNLVVARDRDTPSSAAPAHVYVP